MWLLFAFLGPILWALSTHIDKYLVEKYFKESDTAVLVVFTGLIGLLMLPFIYYFHPETVHLPLGAISIMVLSGMMYLGALLFYLRALQGEEASVVAPLFQASTIFTFALGYIVLGETISPLKAFGVALIVTGALLLSFHGGRFRFSARLVFFMLLATFTLALSSVLFKFFAIHEEFWSTTFWVYTGEALFGVGILLIPKYWKQFVALLRHNTNALVAINAANELINLGGGLAVRFASLFVPVVIVSAISSTTTLFVYFFGIMLTLFVPRLGREDLSAGNLIKKGAAALVVAAGVVLANL
jgi:drug/metabolite transporter (DMT)-like permease